MNAQELYTAAPRTTCWGCGRSGVVVSTPDGEIEAGDGRLVSVAHLLEAEGAVLLCASPHHGGEAVCDGCWEER